MEPESVHPSPGDLYVHLAADGGIFLAPGSDPGRSAWVTLADLRRQVAQVPATCRILLSHPDPSPLTTGPAAAVAGSAGGVSEAGPMAETRREEGITTLMSAAFVGATGLLRDLVERGAPVDVRDAKGYTALMFAAQAGEVEALDVLCRAGAAVEATDAEGTTPLMFAAWAGQADAVVRLLTLGADPDRERARPGAPAGSPIDAHGLAVDSGHADAATALVATAAAPTGPAATPRGAAGWVPDPGAVVLAPARRAWPYVLAGAAAIFIVGSVAIAGEPRDMLPAGAAALVIVLAVHGLVRLGARARLLFEGWTISFRAGLGEGHSFDARRVTRIRRSDNRFGTAYRLEVAGYDAEPATSVVVPVRLFGQTRAFDELLARVALGRPELDADRRTAEQLDDWRRRGIGPRPEEYDDRGARLSAGSVRPGRRARG